MAEGDMMRFRVFVFLILVSAVAYGQSVSDSNVKVVYFQADNHAEVRTLNDVVIQSINAGTDKPLEVRVPQIVAIYVQDPNPVFFKYTKGKTTFVTNADYATALAFAKTLGPFAAAANGKTEAAGFSKSRGIQTRQVLTKDDALACIKAYAEQMPTIAKQTLDSNQLPKAQAAVEDWDLDLVEKVLDSADTTSTGTNDGTNTTRVDPNRTPAPLNNGVVVNNFNNQQPTAGNNPQPAPAQPPTAEQQISSLRDEIKTLRNQLKSDAEQKKKIEEAKTTLATLRTFAKAVNGVNKPLRFDPETVDLQQNPTVHLVIDPLPQFATIDTAPRKTGDIAVPLQAYSPVHLSFGPAMVYSFVKAPSFTAEADKTTGKFIITEKPGENRAQNISAMLNITPRAWSDATFGGSFQLGFSPVKDQMGIFGGVQVRVSRLATIGGGYGFQQVPRLDKSQHVDQALDTADALKTSNHFKGGAYVSITLSLPKDAGQ